MNKDRWAGFLSAAIALTAIALVSVFYSCKSAQRTDVNQSGQPTAGAAKVHGGAPGDEVFVRIGDSEVITWKEFNDTYHLDRMSRSLSEHQVERLLDNLVNQRLVYMDGLEKGYDKNPEVLRQLEMRKKQLISMQVIRELNAKTESLSEADMRGHYESNKDKYEIAHLNYILFNLRKYQGDTNKARGDAVKALEKLRAGADLAAVTEEFTGKKKPLVMTNRKGSKSFFGNAFDTAVWNTQEGQVSDIIETPQGFVIIKVVKREKLPFEQAKPYIVQDMSPSSGQKKIEKFYKELRQKYPVQIDRKILETNLRKKVSEEGPSAHRVPVPGRPPSAAPASPSKQPSTPGQPGQQPR